MKQGGLLRIQIYRENPLYYSEEYRFARTQVLKRDKYKCTKCKSKKGITVHHKKSKSKHPDLICELDNMITLCKKCHKKIHGVKWKTKH